MKCCIILFILLGCSSVGEKTNIKVDLGSTVILKNNELSSECLERRLSLIGNRIKGFNVFHERIQKNSELKIILPLISSCRTKGKTGSENDFKASMYLFHELNHLLGELTKGADLKSVNKEGVYNLLHYNLKKKWENVEFIVLKNQPTLSWLFAKYSNKEYIKRSIYLDPKEHPNSTLMNLVEEWNAYNSQVEYLLQSAVYESLAGKKFVIANYPFEFWLFVVEYLSYVKVKDISSYHKYAKHEGFKNTLKLLVAFTQSFLGKKDTLSFEMFDQLSLDQVLNKIKVESLKISNEFPVLNLK